MHVYADKHNAMTNVTTRIAVKITNLPPFEFSWADTKPQKPWSSLIVDDVLPSSLDGKLLFERAVEYVMQFLNENFRALKKVPLRHSNSSPPKKSTVIPMPVLLRDEKYIDETIQILHDYKRECDLTGDPEVNYIC